MKTKTIPFDLETVKKIQAGEIEGEIKTREGDKARILCTDIKSDYPMAVVITKESGAEELYGHCLNGKYIGVEIESENDLYLEVPDDEPQFKPFERVLTRDWDDETWEANLFSHEDKSKDYRYCVCGETLFRQCIPYEGNEHLAGTSNKPKEE